MKMLLKSPFCHINKHLVIKLKLCACASDKEMNFLDLHMLILVFSWNRLTKAKV